MKCLKDILNENPDLSQKVTYDEYLNGACAPQSQDCSIEEAYAAYQEVVQDLREGRDGR